MSSNLSVALDVSAVPYGRGVSRYTSNLARALAARADTNLQLWGSSWQHAPMLEEWMQEFGSQVGKKHWKVPPKFLDSAWRLGFPSLRTLGVTADVFHAWEWQVPPPRSSPVQVVTIHDLAHMLYPEVAHPEVVRRFDRLIALWEEQQNEVIAVSQATKNDIVRLTAIDPDKVHVIYEALPEEAKYVPSQAEREEVLKQLGLTRPFLLVVGTREPRKNMKRMINAWLSHRKDFECVVVGAPGWDELPNHEGLHVLEHISPQVLSSLYGEAHGLLFASLYEGFGLPILEAFFHGCPVVTSRISSMPEVAGEAAFYCDPYSVESIADAISKLPARKGKSYQLLQSKMDEQISRFSWQETAARTRAVYQRAKGDK